MYNDFEKTNRQGWTIAKYSIVFFLLFLVGVFVVGFMRNGYEATKKKEAEQALATMKTRQKPEAQAYVEDRIKELMNEGHTIDKGTDIGKCAYDKVVAELSGIEKGNWTQTNTKNRLLTAFDNCKKNKQEKEEKKQYSSESTKQVTAHLVCKRYAKSYFFPYEVKFHDIAGVIYDAARGSNEWVYTLDITVKSAQGGSVRYNMDCVAGKFSNDNNSAEVVMFEALPY